MDERARKIAELQELLKEKQKECNIEKEFHNKTKENLQHEIKQIRTSIKNKTEIIECLESEKMLLENMNRDLSKNNQNLLNAIFR